MVQKKSRRKATVKRIARVRRPAPKKPYTPSPRTDGEVHANGILVGYARVSTLDQNPTMQRDALNDADAPSFSSNRCPGQFMIVRR